ncbi:hypothetical protein ANACOL_03950 [Anaerotruncus colihominis DSM 17241]|uniref:Uncharacterized protein n=1 Tax=Anaerotruncus colihominis DSM 17241 TaxID=445972 RepID=B0PGT2_9FIRM|nr:hypothetical protein ANACOL_03950 [Anaerotruncus colihominis DSM 17241]
MYCNTFYITWAEKNWMDTIKHPFWLLKIPIDEFMILPYLLK